jgi:hypothetical protein
MYMPSEETTKKTTIDEVGPARPQSETLVNLFERFSLMGLFYFGALVFCSVVRMDGVLKHNNIRVFEQCYGEGKIPDFI